MYRLFALLAFGTTILIGVPLGIRILAWLYLGASAVSVDVLQIHASVQLFSFFGTLIVGVAHHLLPRFTGRAVRATALTPWLVACLALAAALRVAGAWGGGPGTLAAAAALQFAAFGAFGGWVWRMLDPPPLRALRRHLALATAWLACACALETSLRIDAIVAALPVPAPAAMQIVYAMALFGGVVGWVLGVLLRAGPMFVVDWHVPPAVAGAIPALLALAVALAAASQLAWLDARPSAVLARLADAVGLGTIVAALVGGGALRRARRALPMLSRSAAETRLFRLALACAAGAAVGATVAVPLAWAGGPPSRLVADAIRHLFAVGVLTSLVAAMTFRLIPALEGVPLRWPWLRGVAFWALLAAAILRTSQIAVGFGGRPLAHAVALSGVLVWLAVTAVGTSAAAAMLTRARELPYR